MITTEEISLEIKETKPMSIYLKNQIDELSKALEKIDVKKASKNE